MRTIAQLADLTGRRALVTGGAGHIALAISQALIELGAHVAILDKDEGLQERVDLLNGLRPGCVEGFSCDLLDEAATRKTVGDILTTLKGLDIFIHSAAYIGTTKDSGWAVPFEDQTVGAWNSALHVNLTSAFIILQETHQALRESGRGSVIFIGSIYGTVGPDWGLYEETTMVNPVGYGVSKGGLLQLMRYFSTILAPLVRVNAISLGGIERGQSITFRQKYQKRTPLDRMGREEDIKGAVAYLASDMSSYVTGHNLMIDGGWTAW